MRMRTGLWVCYSLEWWPRNGRRSKHLTQSKLDPHPCSPNQGYGFLYLSGLGNHNTQLQAHPSGKFGTHSFRWGRISRGLLNFRHPTPKGSWGAWGWGSFTWGKFCHKRKDGAQRTTTTCAFPFVGSFFNPFLWQKKRKQSKCDIIQTEHITSQTKVPIGSETCDDTWHDFETGSRGEQVSKRNFNQFLLNP